MTKTPAQLDREINEALARPLGAAPNDKQPLYGHTSEASAYLVEDYPYGFRERTQIRYWLETKPNKGWRFVSQTKNPKTGRWNKPKVSTYVELGAAMYLDNNGHVQWEGIGAYSDERKILEFVRAFPGAKSELPKIVPAKLRLLNDLLSGKRFFTINGVPQPKTEADDARLRRELEVWEKIRGELAR
jgi:hypothetical protein